VSADEPDMTDLVPPKLVPNGAGTCTRGDPDVSLDECKAVADGTDQKFKDNPAFILNSESFTSVNSDGYTSVTWSFSCENCGFGGSPKTFASYASYVYNRTSETCPPDEFPEHNISVTGDNDSIMCAKPYVPEDCPAGYHSKAVSAQIGGTECVPKECPPAGSGENLSSSPATGGVPFSGGGMYCNDGCAYSVPASNITSQGYASGTSQGVSCGDKPYDNKKLADEGNEGGCKTTTDSSGVSVMTCDTPADQPEAEDTDVDNEENKTDDTPNTKKPLEDCAIDDTACLLRNLQTSSENNNQDVIDNDNLLHNKLIDAITNNTNVIKNSVENLDTTVYLAQQENSKNDTIKIQKLDGIIDAIKGIEISGGGGGGGGGTGSGSDGEDCEGSVSDCVPIEGFEIPSQTVDLQQYADKYDDWLPNAELPEEKCIVLTTGKSVCLSFEAFILLFKAISGLLVIGALMHSAKIISGAI
tara:strand:- start:2799 stop:4214 length:1416 start_codon:yes stop_codon:yes gene_type:complete